MRLLQRPDLHRHVLVLEALALMVEPLRRHALDQHLERLLEHLPRGLRVDAVIIELERRHAAADADLQPAMAHVVENADLLDQPQRRVERQQVAQHAEPHPLRQPRDGTEIDAGHRHQVERRGVVLGDVEAVERTGFVARDEVGEPLVELLVKRPVRTVDVVP